MSILLTLFLLRLSDNTARSFTDGMKQMGIINNSELVKHVVEQFYQLTTQHYIDVINLKK